MEIRDPEMEIDQTLLAFKTANEANADLERVYQAERERMANIEKLYRDLRGESRSFDTGHIGGLIKKNWKTIAAVGAAAGFPMGLVTEFMGKWPF